MLFHFLGTQKSVRGKSAQNGSVKNHCVALPTKGISRIGREMNLNPPEGLWRCTREGWERGVVRLGWERRKKKSLGNFNTFGSGGIASAGAGISGFRAGLELSDLAEALQGHARGEVPLVPTTRRAD